MELQQLTIEGVPVPVEKAVPVVDEQIIAIGRSIRAAREEKGIRMRYCAIRAGITPGYLGRIERGAARPSLTTLLRLANVIGVDVVSVINGVEPIPEPM